jgi:hypothetical protein
MARLARAMLEASRTVDLTGLDDGIGRLCAAALDLPPAEGRQLRPTLEALRCELERLDALLARSALSRPPA